MARFKRRSRGFQGRRRSSKRRGTKRLGNTYNVSRGGIRF